MWQKIWKKGGWSRFVWEGAFFDFLSFIRFFVIFWLRCVCGVC